MNPVNRASVPHRLALIGIVLALTACEILMPPPPAPPPPPPAPSASQIYARAPERALINGLRFYEDGAFDRAESSFRSALLQGLRDRRDAAVAHKYLAFIACAFNRVAECESNFRTAIAADPDFRLTDAEIGHPIWGPVYRKITKK